ncbi:TlpA family protein disulfide reductase [Angustibacter sp. McL0619]|uniref:TlpA family protein disulfide reductase n=1 Tax=Angustibacter sp. McL0619 TaxID=3415676 RepID=UPI003CEE3659
MLRRLAVPSVLVALALLAAGCSDGSGTIAAQANAGDGKGYVAGDGTIEQIAPAQRKTAIQLRGKTLEGKAVDTADYRGKVLVVNTWGSWCGPCNAEAPLLQRTWAGYAGSGDVQFLGVDTKEGPAAGQAFQRRMALTYPSLAWDGGGVLLQLKGKASATPTTVVIDQDGKLAGRISGEVQGSTLKDLVDDVVAERHGAS